MDESTGQGTAKLPRRLPKQPNQLSQAGAPKPVAETRSLAKPAAVEELLPVFELGSESPDVDWPQFPPQEFSIPEKEVTPSQEFTAQSDFPAREFSIADEYAAPPQEFVAPPPAVFQPQGFVAPAEVPTPLRQAPPPPRPQFPSQPPPETQSHHAPAPSDIKSGVLPVGDPKPAFARPPGRSRSRPSRPSGTFSAVRLSGEYAVPETRPTTFANDQTRPSGEVVSASAATAAATAGAPASTRSCRSARRWRA